MASITIKNVGPIKNIENLELNNVNVFMGPQSCGKSTIAKIISFCKWMEKRLAREGALYVINRDICWIKELKTYHRLMNGYFSDKSAIYYEGKRITYSFNCDYKDSEVIVTGTEKEQIGFYQENRGHSSKVIYIPAERNFVSVIPNLEKYAEQRDSIQDFIGSWFEAKRLYNFDNKLPILNLGVQYHTDSNDVDFLTLEDEKSLTLQTASSGLQSIVPLLALFDYVAIGLYGKSKPMSIRERDALIAKYVEMVNRKKEDKESIDSNDLEALLDIILSKNYVNSQIVIEEPEQNLFPTTQRDLMYHLLGSLRVDRGDSATITTHSPYILYAINNCMMGYLVNNLLKGAEKDEYLAINFLSQKSWINPKLVSIWEIEDGKLRNIQDKDNIISENYFDKIMTELTDEYYQMLNYYKNEG